MTTDVYVGLDLGTSGLKAVAVDGDGQALARAGAGYPTARPEPGASEQDPTDWLAAAGSACRAVVAQLPAGARVAAIGLSAMLPTLVTADAQLRPTGPALTWEDARAERHGAALRAASDPDRLYRASGQWLDGRYLIPMYLRVAELDADRAAATTWLLGAKDWLHAQLTGEQMTDPSTATGVGGYVLADGGWDATLLAAVDRPLPRRPEVVAAETAPGLRAGAAELLGVPAGTPVCVGGADSVLGALGMGAAGIGDVAYVAGTSTVLLGIGTDLAVDDRHRYLVTPLAGAPGWGYEMDLLSTGSALRWLTRLVGAPDEASLVALAGEVDPADAPVVLPYLAPGEQGALWDPDLRGAIVGLTLADEPRHLARGLLSGIVLESRRCLAVLAEHGIDGAIQIAGGSGSDPGFRADLADASGRAVQLHADDEVDYSAAGAARLAAAACGHPIPTRPATGARHEPRPERAALWAELAERHDQIRQALPGPAPRGAS